MTDMSNDPAFALALFAAQIGAWCVVAGVAALLEPRRRRKAEGR